jgi:hypothetical protein
VGYLRFSIGMIAAMLFAVLLAACQPPVHVTPTAGPQLLSQVRSACATTAYRNCERDALEAIRSLAPPVLVLICDLGSGNGKVMSTLSRQAAPFDCSEGGTIPGTSVVAIIGVTDPSADGRDEIGPIGGSRPA